eukprot:9147958-Lingulodinium_polyedra.AAC.1
MHRARLRTCLAGLSQAPALHDPWSGAGRRHWQFRQWLSPELQAGVHRFPGARRSSDGRFLRWKRKTG